MRNTIKKCVHITIIYVIIFILINYFIGIISFGKQSKEFAKTSPTSNVEQKDTLSHTVSNETILHQRAVPHKTVAQHHIDIVNSNTNSQFNPKQRSIPQDDPFIIQDDVSRITQIQDVFISIKTTGKYHEERVDIILETWWMFAQDQVRS